MKKPLLTFVLSCLAAGFTAVAQNAPAESTPAPDAPPAREAAPAPVDTNTPPVSPAPAPADTGAAGPAPATDTSGVSNEVVPLIVIDEVPLTDAIRNLARQSSINFQFDPKVTTSNQPMVTIRFENVTANEALEAVLDNYNLQLVREPKSKIGRVTYRVPKAEEPLYSRIVQLKYAEPTNMVALVKPTLSQRSSVLADSRTSQLIITTTLKELESATALIEKLDTPTRQVLIEAHLLETAHAPTSVKGIDWSGTLEAQKFSLGNNALPGTAATQDRYVAPPAGSPAGTPSTFVPGQPATLGGVLNNSPGVVADTSKGGFGFNPSIAYLNADGVSAVLSFLNKDADTEVIATPRAVTLDAQPAMLSVTRAFPIFQVTPGSANSPAGAQIQYTNLGVILNVTPRIAADNNIALKVVPEVSNIDGKDQQTINNLLNVANIYAIRKIETQVLIPSGNTLVMGGLINDTQNKTFTKVPLLGDLPGIGMAFRKDEKRRNKVNLMIFVTPTIVDDAAFQTTTRGTEFLKTRIAEKTEKKESFWDSGKPYDWTKPAK